MASLTARLRRLLPGERCPICGRRVAECARNRYVAGRLALLGGNVVVRQPGHDWPPVDPYAAWRGDWWKRAQAMHPWDGGRGLNPFAAGHVVTNHDTKEARMGDDQDAPQDGTETSVKTPGGTEVTEKPADAPDDDKGDAASQ